MNPELWSDAASRRRDSFASRLEAHAHKIVNTSTKQDVYADVERVVAREIALVLDQIQDANDVHATQLRSLLRVECFLDTELIHMEQRTPRYSPYRFPEREKLQRQLIAIEGERRRLAGEHAHRLAHLHDRLLTCLNRHGQVSVPTS